jgi:5-methyltetrahydropteroyltriglutamate--homocysteine methyltransferase
VIAGTDCGFASTLVPGQRPEIEPEIVWAKLKSLVEGARIATRKLWGRSSTQAE